MRNCARDEGGPFGFGNQVLISSHRKLLRSKAVVVSVAETPGQDSGRHGRSLCEPKHCRAKKVMWAQSHSAAQAIRPRATLATKVLKKFGDVPDDLSAL
jgi:hypothetical protein